MPQPSKIIDALWGMGKFLMFVGFLIGFPFLLADKCSRDEESKKRKVELAASIEKINEDFKRKRVLDDLAKASAPPFGFALITPETKLSIGAEIYLRSYTGGRPTFVGTIVRTSEDSITLSDQRKDANLAIEEFTGRPAPKRPTNFQDMNISQLQLSYLVRWPQVLNLPETKSDEQ